MILAEKIMTLRKKNGWSQEELAGKLGVSRQTISKWELAQSYPDFQRLVLISDYFGMPLDTLVKDIDVQDVRDKNLSDKQLTAIYDDVFVRRAIAEEAIRRAKQKVDTSAAIAAEADEIAPLQDEEETGESNEEVDGSEAIQEEVK